MSNEIWDTVYRIDGSDLADFITGWVREDNGWVVKATRYGEQLLVSREGTTLEVFRKWSKWRENVGYYFDSYVNWTEKWDEDVVIDVFVWKIATVLGILKALESLGMTFRGPDGAEELLFM